MAKYHFSKKEKADWLAKLPKKSIAAKAIIRTDKGNILLVKPNYLDNWQLPGGGVEAGEDPKKGLLRELTEELKFKVAAESLKIVDTVFRQEQENLILIYECLVKIDESEKFLYAHQELDGYKYEAPNRVASQLARYWQEFCENYFTE